VALLVCKTYVKILIVRVFAGLLTYGTMDITKLIKGRTTHNVGTPDLYYMLPTSLCMDRAMCHVMRYNVSMGLCFTCLIVSTL
jgi:hypothetical protein